jgi:nicotinate-nucleotide adenylyltransferase
MRFAVLGGSFDPVHNGHIEIAEAALSRGYDKILFIPAWQTPLKGQSLQDSAQIRLDMLLASIHGNPCFIADDFEVRQGGISYTINTLRYIGSHYELEGKIGLILGDDHAVCFPQWKAADEIIKLADILIARRENHTPAIPYPHKHLNNKLCSISSKEVRYLMKQGKRWEHLVPDGARKIIIDRGLYDVRKAL